MYNSYKEKEEVLVRRQYPTKAEMKSFKEIMEQFPKYDSEARKELVLKCKRELVADGVCSFKNEKQT